MKDWEDIIKERQAGRKADLPESDWNDFLSRRAAHERATKKRRRILAAAISIPAAAAVLLLIFLIPLRTVAPDNQVSQNNQSEQPIITDSVVFNPVDSVMIPTNPQPEKTVIIEPKPIKNLYAQDKQLDPQVEWVELGDVAWDKHLEAQNHSVTGSIYDFDSAEPLYSAAVMIYQVNGADTTYIGGGPTDDNGEFIINNLEPGNYIASARFVGFDDAYRNFTISPVDSMTDLGKIAMRGDQGRLLSDLAVSAVVAKVQMINDTAKFNSAAYRLPEGASVEDLIHKLPGVEIDSAGNVTVNGKAVSKILVNGKEFFSDDKQWELTQLTAEMIEKVKAYEKQSDLSQYTGIDIVHEYVDLGVSVKWATCNVGASKPEEVGGLYAWGEIETKLNYSYSTYKFSVDGVRGNYTKYCSDDNKTVLDLDDDVAHVKWGGSWRMPTGAEMDELRKECKWTWTEENGVNGYRVSGKKEGFEDNSIFLPVNAFNDSTAIARGQYPEFGIYWSSSLSHDAASFLMGGWDHANGWWFCRDAPMGNGSYRNEGRSVRPVCP